MEKKYYKSDFTIIENKERDDYQVPFQFKYCCEDTPGQLYIVSYDGTEYKRCCYNEEDGSLEVMFDNQHMGVGKLVCSKTFLVPDEEYPDGNRKVEYKDVEYDVELVKVVTSIRGTYDKKEKKVTLVTHGGDAKIEDDKIILNGLGVALDGETIVI